MRKLTQAAILQFAASIEKCHMNPDLIPSIGAIQDCMRFLSLRLDRREHAYDFRVAKVNGNSQWGTASGYFRNDPHAHKGPWLEFDETIRGYGIRYDKFTPQFQTFEFSVSNESANDGYLTVTNSDPAYTFVLLVRR